MSDWIPLRLLQLLSRAPAVLKINWGISRDIRKQTRQEARSFPIFLRLPKSDIADTQSFQQDTIDNFLTEICDIAI